MKKLGGDFESTATYLLAPQKPPKVFPRAASAHAQIIKIRIARLTRSFEGRGKRSGLRRHYYSYHWQELPRLRGFRQRPPRKPLFAERQIRRKSVFA